MNATAIHQVVIPSPRLLRFLRQQAGQVAPLFCPIGSPHAIRSPCSKRLLSSVNSSREVKLLPPPRSRPFPHHQQHHGREANYSAPTLSSQPSQHHRRRRSSLSESKKPLLRRLFSSTKERGIWSLFGLKKADHQHGNRLRDLPPLAGFLDDTQNSGRILNAANEPRLRCTEFDENGSVTLVNGEFKKSELIAKVRYVQPGNGCR